MNRVSRHVMQAGLGGSRCRAYVLVELLLGLLLAGLFWVLLSVLVLTLQRMMCPPTVPYEGNPIPLAPSALVLPRALGVNRVLSRRLGEAKAVYAFGGLQPGPNGGQQPCGRPLAREGLPTLSSCDRGLPMSADLFLSCYAQELGGVDSSAQDETDFSLLVLGPREEGLGASCFIQCRSQQLPSDGVSGILVLRTCRCWDWKEGFTEYRFAERVPASGPARVGAYHSWYRLNRNLHVEEEGPLMLILPDPVSCPAGSAASSHFSYCVAVNS